MGEREKIPNTHEPNFSMTNFLNKEDKAFIFL